MSIFTNCGCMRGSRKYFQRWSNFDNAFLVDERREDPNATICGPTSARQRNRWRADDGPTLNAGLVALCFLRGSRPVLLWNSICLWIFRGEGIQVPCRPCSGQTHIVGIVHTYGVVQLWFSVALYKWSSVRWKEHSRYQCVQIMAVCDRFSNLLTWWKVLKQIVRIIRIGLFPVKYLLCFTAS